MASYGYEPLPPGDQISINEEQESLLPTSTQDTTHKSSSSSSKPAFLDFCRDGQSGKNRRHGTKRIVSMALGAGFASGVLSVLLFRYCFPATCYSYDAANHQSPFSFHPSNDPPLQAADFSFPADIGATEVHEYPPASPTNDVPSLFPTEIGFAGATATGAEPGLVLTAPSYPTWKGVEGLLRPKVWDGSNANKGNQDTDTPSWIEDDTSGSSSKHQKKQFDIFQHWGNLSPFYSVPSDSFGIESKNGPEVPPSCEIKGVHILHRHGARYPTGRCQYLLYSMPQP